MEFKAGQRVEIIKAAYSAGVRGYVRGIDQMTGLGEVIWDKPVVNRDMAGQLVEHKATMIRADLIRAIEDNVESIKMPKVASFAEYRLTHPIKSVVDVIQAKLRDMSWKERMNKRGKKHRGK